MSNWVQFSDSLAVVYEYLGSDDNVKIWHFRGERVFEVNVNHMPVASFKTLKDAKAFVESL